MSRRITNSGTFFMFFLVLWNIQDIDFPEYILKDLKDETAYYLKYLLKVS